MLLVDLGLVTAGKTVDQRCPVAELCPLTYRDSLSQKARFEEAFKVFRTGPLIIIRRYCPS